MPKNRESYFLPFKRESSCRRRCSPPPNAKAEKNPTSPVSRGAEAIPATRERRSRRAYHPRSGKMRADLPHAASGGQGTRHATVTPSATRKRGSTGVVGGVGGLAPLTPCRQPRRLPHPDAGLKPQASGNKKRKKRKRPAQGHPSEGSSARRSTCPGCAACPAYRSSRVPCAAS